MNTKSTYPSSVVKGIPRLGRKPEGWREVAFGDVLEVVKRPATIDPDQSYQLINVKRNRRGVIPRETKRGSEIKTQTQFHVAADDFVISRRQIVHGACGIVPPKLSGALVSNEYVTLVPKNGLCMEFLACFSHTSHFQKTCFHASVGVVIEKMIFNLDAWLKHRFYLPPLEEQKRIVRILAAVDQAIARTEDLIAVNRKFKGELAQQLLSGVSRVKVGQNHGQGTSSVVLCRYQRQGLTRKTPKKIIHALNLNTYRRAMGALSGWSILKNRRVQRQSLKEKMYSTGNFALIYASLTIVNSMVSARPKFGYSRQITKRVAERTWPSLFRLIGSFLPCV